MANMNDASLQPSPTAKEIEKLQAEIAAARAEDEAHAERVRVVMQCSIDARESIIADLRKELAALKDRIRFLEDELTFSEAKVDGAKQRIAELECGAVALAEIYEGVIAIKDAQRDRLAAALRATQEALRGTYAEIGEKDYLMDDVYRNNKAALDNLPPEQAKPLWGKEMAEVHPCGHTTAQHLYHNSGDVRLTPCAVVSPVEPPTVDWRALGLSANELFFAWHAVVRHRKNCGVIDGVPENFQRDLGEKLKRAWEEATASPAPSAPQAGPQGAPGASPGPGADRPRQR